MDRKKPTWAGSGDDWPPDAVVRDLVAIETWLDELEAIPPPAVTDPDMIQTVDHAWMWIQRIAARARVRARGRCL